MANRANSPQYDPRVLDRALFELSKKWWLLALLCKLVVFVVSVVVILAGVIPQIAPFVTVVLSIAAELLLWQSNRTKGTAEALLRKLDSYDSFGWPISGAEMSDLLATVPSGVKARLSNQVNGKYFASGEDPGPIRAVEDVQESAWWSKHLAARCSRICLWTTCIAVSTSIVLIVVSIETIRDFDVLSSIGRVVTSTIALIFSLGLFRLTVGYYDFSRKSARVERETDQLLRHTGLDSIQAVKLAYEYQLARASAPLIPTWIYDSMRSEFNELWARYRRRSSSI
jgi:hypothetical protein